MTNSNQADFQGFTRAYSTYNRYRKTLKRVYNETIELYTGHPCGLKASDYLDLDHKKLTINEEALLNNTIHNPPAIVIIGQTYKAKCLFVSQLLGLKIVPLSSESWLKQARMLKFKYGPRPQVSISLQDNFVIIEPRMHSSSTEDLVNWEQEFSLLEGDLKKIDGGVVEITLQHSLLKGCQVILCSGQDSLSDVLYQEKSALLNEKTTSVLCTNGISPIFVYAFEKEWVYVKEGQNLANLRRQYPDNAIAFSIQNSSYYSEELENQPPCNAQISDKTAQLQPNDCQCEIKKVRTKSDTCILNDVSKIKTDVRKLSNSLLHSDICNNKVKNTLQEVVSLQDSASSSPADKSKALFCNKDLSTAADYCVDHGDFTQDVQKILCDLTVVGYQFACTCKGPIISYNNLNARGSDSDWDSSTEEAIVPDSCSQGNPSYTSLNLDIFNDARLQHFPPNSIFLIAQTQERLQARMLSFTRSVAKYYLVRAAKVLHRLHSGILDNSIRCAFQMSRDLMITPKRMEYAKDQENQLFSQLVEISTKKQVEIQELISGIKVGLRENILNAAGSYMMPDDDGSFRQVSFVKREIQDLVLRHVKVATAERLYSSIQVLRESYIGTLSRCLESLESSVEDESHPGTTSKHLKRILHAAYNVQLNIQSSSSLARIMIDKLRQLISNLPWHEPPLMNNTWRRNVASDVLASLDDSRLAKSICSQFRARLNQSHSAFHSSLRQLESTHLCRLEHTEEKRHKVAKIVAPHVARLALESTSLIDSVMFGTPRMGREIGRGMYGVVYQCDAWSSWSPCAVKSVAPPDEKHANDLSLEFYYTRSLPEHPRIVQIRGSIVDESYARGIGPPAVLLIMDRMHCDLYMSIKRGLGEINRMQVAVDVVEGIRFLHGQGLIHRDIKLKNVLLDRKNRAKITDLGFCKPGAMISGSIVGTPVHMPPELFSGKYDSSVDVYAFGVLFWYLCAGVTRLPRNFEVCTTKDHLWNAVRKGVRPERLPMFTDECWSLMKACWQSDSSKRPLLGKIQPKLITIHNRMKRKGLAAQTTAS